MSRSYCKVLNFHSEDTPKKRISFRGRNRQCISREMKNPEYGDVVFPIVKECLEMWSRGERPPVSKKEIRNRYFLDVRNILNGYSERHRYYEESWDESFIDAYGKIISLNRGSEGRYSAQFKWLDEKSIRKIIRNWPGEPFEVLKHLADTGLIEKAVSREFKLAIKK